MSRIGYGFITLSDISDGIAGARNAVRYLYYTSQTDVVPSAPSATITWSTGALSAITTDWSETPPVVDATGTDRPWVSTVTFHQASSSSQVDTTTATGTTPKKGFTFDGVVTFTNNDLTDGSTTYNPATVVNAGTTTIDGGKITANSITSLGSVTAGTFSLGSGKFAVDSSGKLSATDANISGDITANNLNVTNATVTGDLIATGLVGFPNVESTNMTQSLRNAIEEIIVSKFGSDASTGYYADATGTFGLNDDNAEICKVTGFVHNGSNVDIDVTFSRSWLASAAGTPSVVVNIQRKLSTDTTWTTIKTQTVTGTSTQEPETGDYFAGITGVVSANDNPDQGTYDYRFLTGNVLNTSTISITARLEANEQGEQIGTIDLANYAALAQDETITGDWTFSGTTSGISYDNLNNKPTLITQTDIDNSISALVDSAPATLDTLNELAAALGDDANFAQTTATALGTKWTQDNTKISNWDDAYEAQHSWEWRWQRWAGTVQPPVDSTDAWQTYYETYFAKRTSAIDSAHPFQDGGYLNTIDDVDSTGGFGGSTYGNMFGNLSTYHCLIYTNIYVDKEFTVNITNFSGDDPHAIFVDGKFVHGRIPCCTDTAYSYTFTQGWHRIDLIYSEGGGGDWIRMGWNPKDYTANISDMVAHRGSDNPIYLSDKINAVNNSANWDAAYGWGDHSTQGYLTSLPSHTHDYLPLSGGTLTGGLSISGYNTISSYAGSFANLSLSGGLTVSNVSTIDAARNASFVKGTFSGEVLQNDIANGWSKTDTGLSISHTINDTVKLSRAGSGYMGYYLQDVIHKSFHVSFEYKVNSGATHWGLLFNGSASDPDNNGLQLILRNLNDVRIQQRLNSVQTYPVNSTSTTGIDLDSGWHKVDLYYQDGSNKALVYVDGTKFIDSVVTSSFTSGVIGLVIYDGSVDFRGLSITDGNVTKDINILEGFLPSTHDMTLTLSGDATGSTTFTDMGNATLSVAVANDSHNHSSSSGDFSVGSNITANRYFQRASGIPTNNLGSPTVTEMALFDGQFNNKTEYYPPSSVRFYQTVDGTTWTEITTYSDDQKKRFLHGDATSGVVIPNLVDGFRIEVESQGYVFLNALYMYWSSNSHSTKVHVYRRRNSDGAWLGTATSDANVSSWPGHLYLPFSTITFNPSNSSQHNKVRIEFLPNWSGHATYGDRNINLYSMQLWGGYPAGRRNVYYTDQDHNVDFPSEVKGTSFNADSELKINGTTVVNASRNAAFNSITGSGGLTLTGGISASGYNNTNWDTAYGWGNHASAGYLTSLPSHNHDDRYYTESESDSRFANITGDTFTGNLQVNGGYLQAYGLFYLRDDLNFINAAANGWHTIIEKNNGNPYFNAIDSYRVGGTTVIDSARNGLFSSISTSGKAYIGSDDDFIRVGGAGGGKSGVFGNRMTRDGSNLSYGAYLSYDAFWNGSAWQANRTTLTRKWMTHIGGYHDDNFHINRYNGSAAGTWTDSSWTRLLTLDSGGLLNTLSGYQVNGTTVIDSSRNFSGNDGTFAGDVIVNTSNGNNYLRINKGTGGDGGLIFEVADSLKWQNVQRDDGGLQWYSYGRGGTNVIFPSLGDIELHAGGYKIGTTTVIDSSRNLTNIANANISGTITSDSASTIIDCGNSNEVILADHTSDTTPVPFSIRKSGSALSDGSAYGVLHLDRLNHTTGSSGVGSNLYFRVKNNSGNLAEYAGIGGEKVSDTSGRLSFYTYGRDRAMVLEEDGFLNLCNPNGAYRFYSDDNASFLGGIGAGSWGGDDSGDIKVYVAGNNNFAIRTNGALIALTNSTGFDLKSGSYKVNGTTVIDSSRNISNVPTATLTSSNPLQFTGAGSNTYTLGAMYCDSSGLSIEAPLETNDSSGAHRPITLSWRGGYSAQGGLQIREGVTEVSRQLKVKTDGENGYVQGAVRIETIANYRGAGVFLDNTAANEVWYAGTPYTTHNGYYMIGYASGLGTDAQAQLSYYKLRVDNAGNVSAKNSLQVNGTTVIDVSRNISGVNLDLTGRALIWTNTDAALVLRQGQSGHPWNYIEFRNSANERNWYTGTDSSGNYVMQGETGATGVYTNKRLTAEGLTSNGVAVIDSDHGNTRLQLKYRHAGVEDSAYSGHLTLWTSEPGITYDNCGIGGNINVGGQHYGRQINSNAYGVYLRFDVNSGFSEFWSTTGNAGTAGGQGGRRWYVDASGNTNQTGSLQVGGTTVIDSSRNATFITTNTSKLNVTQLADLPIVGMTYHTNNWAYLNGGENGLIVSTKSNGSELIRVSSNATFSLGGTTVIDSSKNLTSINGLYIGNTSHGDSHYQWEGATYRNPSQWTAKQVIKIHNDSVNDNGHYPSLVLYNESGLLGSTVGLSFASREADNAGNSVPLAGIQANKTLAGNAGAWSSGSLSFYVKDLGTRRNVMICDTDGALNVVNSLKINTTEVIDSSRNLTNIKGISASQDNVLIPYVFRKNEYNGYNGAVAKFVSTHGHHSWGINTEFRVDDNDGDRPSILFSHGADNKTWSVGYGGGTSDYFRINRDHGYHNSAWGIAMMTLDRSGNVVFAGNVTAYSDARLKDNVKTLDGSKVYEMRGVSFTKDGELGSGVIAQELEQVAPELVMTNDDEMQTKSVAYGNVVGYLIEAIKELKQEIEVLKNGTNSN